MGDLPESIAAADSLAVLESLLGYRFRDQQWLIRALTHRSFVNERGDEYVHNESLEFLGDSVLGFLVSARIFQRFPDLSEGDLSKLKAYLVSAVNLVHLAERIKLGEFLRLSRGEEKTGGRMKKAILVDSYEAILGAIYLDGGIEAASEFLERELGQIFERPDVRQLTYGDFKSALQEHLHNLSYPEPIYRVVGEIGPDHKKTFVVEVIIADRVMAQASGKSKKEAQQAAAQQALERLM